MVQAIVTSIADYTIKDDGVEMTCAVEFESAPDPGSELQSPPVPVRIRFFSPTVFRFELHANPDVPESESPIETDPEAISEPVSLSVTESADDLRLETEAITVVVGTDPWSFRVERTDGETILEEQREDRNAKELRLTSPLGFETEEINEWPHRIRETGTSFRLGADEHVYGIGEKFTEFDKRGQHVNAWVTQPNGTEGEAAYTNVPFYLSSRGYGLLIETGAKAEFDVGNKSVVTSSVNVHDDSFRFVFFAGDEPADSLQSYTAYTGRPEVPPKWSFGVWMSRLAYETREELESVTERLRAERMPCDVVHLDPYWMDVDETTNLEWNTDAFPDPEGMIDDLHDDGFRLCLWEHPYIMAGCDAYDTAVENGYFVEDGTGDPYFLSRFSVDRDRGCIVDFTDEGAVEWWQEKHRRLLEMGVDVFKTDFGEYLPEDAVLSNGRSGKAMRNLYPHLYQQTVYEVMAESPAVEDPLLWARSGWIGSQQYPVHWSGDPYTSFESMAACLRGGLSLVLSGYPFWSCDIGGFRGEPTTDLYVRWAQFGLMGTSHPRFHGTTPREPWHYGKEALDIVREYANERYRLLPYIYSYAKVASERGQPVMRPLILEYPDDAAASGVQTQLLLGEHLLVAPVTNPEGTVAVYLPEGEWVDYWTGESHAGNQTLHLDVNLDTMPVFVEAGSVVPRQEPVQHVREDGPDTVTLRTTLRSDGPTDATFEWLDEDRDELRVLEASVDTDHERVAFDVPDDRRDLFEASVTNLAATPEAVTLDGEELARVDADPASGEWTVDDGGDVLAVF